MGDAMKTWMVRGGRGGVLIETFKEKGLVGIRWGEMGSLVELTARELVIQRYRETYPEDTRFQVGQNAGQVHRFRNEIAVGDRVISYDPIAREYLVGSVAGPYTYDDASDPPNCRAVKWTGTVARDALSPETRNSLGSIATLFLLPPETAEAIDAAMAGAPFAFPEPAETQADEAAAEETLLEDMEEKAFEFVKDRLAKLNWSQMQDFVAGLLRAMGYKTRVSSAGSDRGKDIFASPDGLGFEDPRIFVEVKHHRDAVGSQTIRSFIGGRKPTDRCLFVSIGGFSKDAHYEAERAMVPCTLLDINDLVQLAIEHYERFDVDTRRLLPLKRFYWPA